MHYSSGLKIETDLSGDKKARVTHTHGVCWISPAFSYLLCHSWLVSLFISFSLIFCSFPAWVAVLERKWRRAQRRSGCHGTQRRYQPRSTDLPEPAAPGSHCGGVRVCGHHSHCSRLRRLPKVSVLERSESVEQKFKRTRESSLPDPSHYPLLLLSVSTSSELFSSLPCLSLCLPSISFIPCLSGAALMNVNR